MVTIAVTRLANGWTVYEFDPRDTEQGTSATVSERRQALKVLAGTPNAQ